MNVREEDAPKTSSTGRGLGLAAAAIGVGVGAALYYFFSKRENTDAEGTSTHCQRNHEEQFRQRTWTQEECSICFDAIANNQEEMSLPCTHRFHTACILPWLAEQQTCPNCRKTV